MMIEYTLLATLAFHHLVIGGVLVISLSLLHKFVTISAETKSWLWMTAFVVSTLVPLSLLTFDSEETVTTITMSEDNGVNTEVVSQGEHLLISENGVPVYASETYWHLPTSIVFNFSYLLSLALVVWLVGSLWRATTIIRSFVRTQRLMKASLQEQSMLSDFIGVKVYASAKVSSPLVIGFFRPKVILPQSIAEQLPEAQLKAILLHEYAHIERKDNWFGLFQELLAILFWWSLVIRVLNKRIHVEREIACDLRAADKLESGKQYAQSLVDCAKLMINEQRNVLAMGLFSKKKELNNRVGAVLSYKMVNRPHKFLIALLCAGLSISTLAAAQSFSPKISIKHTLSDARHYSLLSERESTLLIRAVSRNDLDTIERLQNDGVDINTPVIGDGTALMIAVGSNNTDMVLSLLDLGADVNQSSEGDGNPLIVAAMRNNLAMAELLLDKGADIDAAVPRDETALINASRFGYLEMVKMLVSRGADVNLAVETGMSDGFELRSPLNQAATNEILDYLIANGATDS